LEEALIERPFPHCTCIETVNPIERRPDSSSSSEKALEPEEEKEKEDEEDKGSGSWRGLWDSWIGSAGS
jgi:hypothetical protein